MATSERVPQKVFLRIASDLRKRITGGELAGRLPTHRALATQYGVSESTVGRAVHLLGREGLVRAVHGDGTFTADSGDYRPLLVRLTELLATGAYPPGSKFPSEQALCARFDVARNTLRTVLWNLEGQGLIGRSPGWPATGRVVLALPPDDGKELK